MWAKHRINNLSLQNRNKRKKNKKRQKEKCNSRGNQQCVSCGIYEFHNCEREIFIFAAMKVENGKV